MIMHWQRHRDQPHWRRNLVFNATGAVLSGIVFVIEGVTKFTAGAWVAIVLIAAITVTALRTRRYYVRTGHWGDHLPLEIIVSPHRAVIAPLVNYLWTLHEQRPDLRLTVALPELVDRHWWHRIMHEHVAERLQPILRSLPRVVATSVPFHLAD